MMNLASPEDTGQSSPMVDGGSGSGRAAFGFVFASAVASALSIGLMVPILPSLLKSFVHGSTAAAARWNTIFATGGSLMLFFSGPIFGMISDRWGRRPVLLIAMAGLGIDFAAMAFAPNLIWLLASRLISGATGGIFSTANAYVADVTPVEQRARAFGWMGAAFNFGFLAGPALGGLLGSINLRLPFMVAAALTLANVLYGIFVLPESLRPENRSPGLDWSRANPIGALALLRSQEDLPRLGAINFLTQLGQVLWPAVFALYTGYRYHWNELTIGLTMMGGSVIGITVQTFIVGPFIRRFGEVGGLRFGCIVGALCFAWYGLAPNQWVYWACMPVSSLFSILVPGLQGLMSRSVGADEQGRLQGANQSTMGLAGLIGPSLFALTFAWAVEHPALNLPGAAHLIAAALMVGAFVLALGVKPKEMVTPAAP